MTFARQTFIGAEMQKQPVTIFINKNENKYSIKYTFITNKKIRK